jgi:hypothetical protein
VSWVSGIGGVYGAIFDIKTERLINFEGGASHGCAVLTIVAGSRDAGSSARRRRTPGSPDQQAPAILIDCRKYTRYFARLLVMGG